MTDQIPADKVRKIIARYRDGASDQGGRILADLKDLLPARPRPTLADMTDEERAACRWMQCGYAGETSDAQSPGVIGYFDHGEKKAVILTTTCGIVRRDYDRVTPRPDLPRLEWPGGTPTGPDRLAVGTVIESADDPRIDALPVGSILLDREGDTTTKRRVKWRGDGYIPIAGDGATFAPWTVLHIPKETDQ